MAGRAGYPMAQHRVVPIIASDSIGEEGGLSGVKCGVFNIGWHRPTTTWQCYLSACVRAGYVTLRTWVVRYLVKGTSTDIVLQGA